MRFNMLKEMKKTDFWTRKIVFLYFLILLVYSKLFASIYSRIYKRKNKSKEVKSIAAVWYWPNDFPAASHTRLGKWKSYFEEEGIKFENFPIGSMKELREEFEAGSWTQRYWFYIKTLNKRRKDFKQLRKYDVVWIDRWFLPYYPSKNSFWENSIKRMTQHLVIDSTDGSDFTGNPELVKQVFNTADRITIAFKGQVEFYKDNFKEKLVRFNYPVIQDNYLIRNDWTQPKKITIGWMGNPYNFEYVKDIEDELQKVADKYEIKIIIISRQNNTLNLDNVEIENHPFDENYEKLIQSFDIGIAPFLDTNFSITGKIGMKHQEFLLCQIPQVCSPQGISEHAKDGVNCIIAKEKTDWAESISKLIEDAALRKEIAINGRQMFLENYTFVGQWETVKNALLKFK